MTRDPTEDGKTHSGAIAKIYKILRSKNFFQHILTQSDDWSDLSCKVNGLCKLPDGKMRRIDILGVPWFVSFTQALFRRLQEFNVPKTEAGFCATSARDDMPAALIYFTGNDVGSRCKMAPFSLSAMSACQSLAHSPLELLYCSISTARSDSKRDTWVTR